LGSRPSGVQIPEPPQRTGPLPGGRGEGPPRPGTRRACSLSTIASLDALDRTPCRVAHARSWSSRRSPPTSDVDAEDPGEHRGGHAVQRKEGQARASFDVNRAVKRSVCSEVAGPEPAGGNLARPLRSGAGSGERGASALQRT